MTLTRIITPFRTSTSLGTSMYEERHYDHGTLGFTNCKCEKKTFNIKHGTRASMETMITGDTFLYIHKHKTGEGTSRQ